MGKTIWVVLGIALALILIVGGLFLYNSKSTPNPIPNPINNNTINSLSVVHANNQFAIDLYSKYKSKDGNLFYSPYSISSALAMTYEGAKGQTAGEMKSVLHLPDNKETIRSDFVSINNEINKEGKSYKLTSANALWVQKDYPFIKDYFDLVDNYYGGKATNLDFKTDTENSRITINKWVEDKTNDKIKNLIPEGILTPDTRLVLTNAIYFKANWSSQFYEESTYDADFKISNTNIVKIPTMHQTNELNYGETDNLQILEMDYLGNDLSMLIILPKDGDLNAVENSLDVSNFAEWKKDMGVEEVEVSIPRFKFETKYFMADDLKEMGMPTAFNPDLADFSGMWNRQNDENLYISEVIHQAFVNVTESGTEAAAATAVVMMVGSAGPEPVIKPKIFKADHPFIFIIQQKDTGNILFMGRVSDPTK